MIPVRVFVGIYLHCKKGALKMVSLKTFVEDLRKERRERNQRLVRAFSLALSVLFLALSIWVSAL
jgi:hypothetical protein